MNVFKIKCPCCKGSLVIDKETGAILEKKPFQEAVQSLDDFLKNEDSRNEEIAEKFQASKELENNKVDILNKKFEWAKKNQDKLPKIKKPDIFWD